MEAIRVLLDKSLLRAADQAARRTKRNRSALVRDALREHLRKLELLAMEEQDRAAYLKQPKSPREARLWEAEAAWPEE
jgi:metal-responsive CopG/Arc/MetJ family transcriptional regulator